MNSNSKSLTDRCYECGNCIISCPVQAVNMIRDNFGCGLAVINTDKCIECGICKRICPSLQPVKKNMPIIAYAAVSKSRGAQNSTSGGIFFELASKILELDGFVVGAAYDKKNWSVCQTVISTQKDLIKLQGSKYVKSDVGDTYQLTKKILENGRWVLYSGTPCQIAGLKKYLGTAAYPKLLTIDIICHGTPPAKIFQDYIKYLSGKRHGQIEEFFFRCKKYGHRHIGKYVYWKGKRLRIAPLYSNESSYFSLFLKSYILNDACYKCSFSDTARAGDITLGDFWGIKTEYPNFFIDYALPDDASISAVMINTSAGRELMKMGKKNLIYQQVDYEKIVKHNPRLSNQVTCKPGAYEILKAEYADKGYEGIEQFFQKNTNYMKYLMRINQYVPLCIKREIKKLLKI